MGQCFSGGNALNHPREKDIWSAKKTTSMDLKNSRPRGATIGGAHPLKQASQARRSRGSNEENDAMTVHEELEFQDDPDVPDIRKSLSEDSLSKKIPGNRVLV
ncbi:hypothetical protein HKI87_18g87690 [Chloropicon roscoffensis]|uniref:Uncharacterized protein n=1 Tax=Chloropicon roscoffensis TaxID=1461544 RepID=A0AAX4PM43_9CHLO